MKLKVFSIYDVKAANYKQPFFMQRKEEAVRSFGDLVNDGRSSLSQHPEDYSLFEIGEFDDLVGKIQGKTGEVIITASSMYKGNLASDKKSHM